MGTRVRYDLCAARDSRWNTAVLIYTIGYPIKYQTVNVVRRRRDEGVNLLQNFV